MIWLWTFAGLVVAIYCFASGFMFLRRKRYFWGAIGLASGLFILLMPAGVKTEAVKIDLPA